MDAGYYRDLVGPLVKGRKLIIAGTPLAAASKPIRVCRELGAADMFVVANGLGTGELPNEDEATWVILDIKAASVMEEFRLTRATLEDLPAEARNALDAWDPSHEAIVLGDPFYTHPELAGRPVYGNRRPAWEALEDKIVVDEVWDQAGVARAPSRVVRAKSDSLRAAAVGLNWGMGTAWAGDTREGFNGGAEYLRWIRADEDFESAAAFFSAHCDRVRIMPFLEGIPCSMHGMVFPDAVIVLRPCEMITLRPPTGNRLRYGGWATFWDPPDADREYMREVGRRVGAYLSNQVGFRGGFTVDGVLTEDGFLPTELNSRSGGALSGLLAGLPDLPMGMIQRAVVEEEPFDLRARELEELIVASADQHRGGGAMAVVTDNIEETITQPLQEVDREYQPTEDVESANAKLLFGPGALGGFLRFVPEPGRTPAGPSLAPRAIAALTVADQLWDTGIGPLQPAKAAR